VPTLRGRGGATRRKATAGGLTGGTPSAHRSQVGGSGASRRPVLPRRASTGALPHGHVPDRRPGGRPQGRPRVGRRRRGAEGAVERPGGALPPGGARRPEADRLHRHDHPRGVRRRWRGPAVVPPAHRGARAGRRQRAVHRLGAPRSGRRRHRAARHLGAEAAVAAAAGHRRGARLLRPDRARLRQRRRQPAGHRREDRVRRLPDQRPQDLHHERHHRRLALVMARTGGPGGKGVSAFLVPTDTPASPRTRSTASWACARATPPSWSSTTSRSARTRCSAARRAPA
jgi:hypothetical protein